MFFFSIPRNMKSRVYILSTIYGRNKKQFFEIQTLKGEFQDFSNQKRYRNVLGLERNTKNIFEYFSLFTPEWEIYYSHLFTLGKTVERDFIHHG